MRIVYFYLIWLSIALSGCWNDNPTKPFVLEEPDRVYAMFYTDVDISHVDSISIQHPDNYGDSMPPVIHEIWTKEYDENRELWRFHIKDSLPVKYNYTFRIKTDTGYKVHTVTSIVLGQHSANGEGCNHCYFWEIRSYMLDGKLFEDSDIYLTSEKAFRDLHSWQVK